MKPTWRDDIDDAGGWLVWLADGIAMIGIFAMLYALVLFLEAANTPVPQ